MLDRKWQGTLINGARVYSLEAYQTGFILMVAWVVAGMMVMVFSRETYCRQLK
jgi:hypothetical protein